jgi:hypothetical protein
MPYSKGSTVAALDYNSLTGFNPTTTQNTINSVWGTGSGQFGYGQTALSTVAVGNSVTADNWFNLMSTIMKVGEHQGTNLTGMLEPVIGSTVTQDPAIFSNLQKLYTNKFDAALQGTTTTNTTENVGVWVNSLVFQHTVTFSSGDAARYFFNMGGQLALTFGSPNGFGINQLLNKLSMDCGTVLLSAPSVGQAKIAGVNYDGVTKIGGNASLVNTLYNFDGTNKIVPTLGYYGLSTSYQEIFKQSVGGFPSRYSVYEGSYISIKAKTNGTQGANGDNGSSIEIQTLWNQVPNGLQVDTGTTTTLTVKPPYLRTGMTKTWGTPVVTGTVDAETFSGD